MSLYHKYRPRSFEKMIGNEDVLETLQADLAKEDRPHAILLHGPVGCGKTTLGRLIATTLGSKGTDFREIDSADFRGIDTIREIRKQSAFKPLEGDCRVWLLDECHKLSNDAQTAMLKALEGAASHVYYILATTDPLKLLKTIRSRCAKYQVSPLTDRQMFRLLRRVVKLEKETLEEEVYEQIIQDSLGLPRNALQILDQTLSAPAGKRLAIARRQAEVQSETIELCRALIKRTSWRKVANILNTLTDQDPETIRRGILGYCNTILLKGENVNAGLVMEKMEEPFYESGFPGLTLACYRIIAI